MIIRLPFPAPELFPNRANGKHWGGRNYIKAKQKSDAYYSTLKAGTFEDKGGNIPISLLFMTPDKRKRDADNMLAASKSLIDGVAQALNVDDSRFKPILVDWVHGDPKVGALVVAVGVQIVSGVAL
jgi:crossover junction endodeoxyribonuclease RusA